MNYNLRPRGYNHEALKVMYAQGHGPEFAKACDAVAAAVPKVICNEGRWVHHPALFQAEEFKYAYFNSQEDRFRYLTPAELARFYITKLEIPGMITVTKEFKAEP